MNEAKRRSLSCSYRHRIDARGRWQCGPVSGRSGCRVLSRFVAGSVAADNLIDAMPPCRIRVAGYRQGRQRTRERVATANSIKGASGGKLKGSVSPSRPHQVVGVL